MSYIRNNLMIGTALAAMAVRSEAGNGGNVKNVYHGPDGKLIAANDHDAIATAYREAAKQLLDEGQVLADMTVEQVYAIVSAIRGSGKDVDAARVMAVYEYEEKEVLPDLSNTTETLQQRIEIYSGSRLAYDVGSKLDTATLEHFDALADAKEDFDGAPLICAADFERQFTTAEITGWPRPGGRWDKPPYSTNMTNELPDYYKVTDRATSKDVKGSVYNDMFLSTTLGRKLERARSLIKLTEGPMLPADVEELERYLVPIKKTAKQLADDVHTRTSAKKWVDNRVNAIVGKLRRAVAFIQQRERVQSLPHFRVFLLDDDVEIAAKKRDPILVEYRPDPNKRANTSDGLSVGTFIKYDIAAAKAKAEATGVPVTFAHIAETTKRQGKKGQGKTTAPKSAPIATDIHQWTEHVYSVAGYVADKDRFASIISACLKDPELLEAVGDLGEVLDGIMPKITVPYNRIKANKAALTFAVQEAAANRAGDMAHAKG